MHNEIRHRFSNRDLLYMLLPIVVNDLTGIFVGIVDSIMVSSVGEAAVSGISLVSSISSIFSTFLNGLSIGCTVVVSQYIGSGNNEKAGNVARQSMFIGLGFGIPIFLFLLCFIPSLLHMVYPDTDAAIMENARIYFLITSLVMPSLATRSMLVGTIRAIGKNKLILILGVAQNILNIAGNALLIQVFNMGVAGAGIATVISSYTCTLICFLLLRDKKLSVNIRGLKQTKFDRADIKLVLSIGLGTSLERCLLVLGKVFVTAMYADLNASAISAYYVSRHMTTICWTLFNGFGTVLMTVVGQCIGANEPEQAKYYTKKIIYFTIPLCFLLNGMLFLFRDYIVQIYALSGETLALAAQYTGLGAALTALCFYPLAILPAYSFRAAGDTRYATVSSTVITILCQVGLCFLFVKCFHMGIVGVWLGMGGDWLARAIVHSIHFSRNKWLTKKVI